MTKKVIASSITASKSVLRCNDNVLEDSLHLQKTVPAFYNTIPKSALTKNVITSSITVLKSSGVVVNFYLVQRLPPPPFSYLHISPSLTISWESMGLGVLPRKRVEIRDCCRSFSACWHDESGLRSHSVKPSPPPKYLRGSCSPTSTPLLKSVSSCLVWKQKLHPIFNKSQEFPSTIQ